MAAIGRILLMPKGTYSASAVYNALDWVRYSGAAWVCTTDNTTNVTPSTSAPEWQLLAEDGTVGGWSSIANKPFETIGNGLDVDSLNALVIDADLDDLTDVDVSSLQNGQLLTYDSATSTWKNKAPDKSFVRYAGAINFTDLATNHATYLDEAYEDAFFLISTGGDIGTGEAALYWSSNFHDGQTIPADSHIAVIDVNRGTGNPPSYKYDDFGGFVDISGKADKTELDSWFSTTATVSSGQVSFSGLDDTQGWSYKPYFNVTSATDKSPLATVSNVVNPGTSSMSITYKTDAANGTSCKLRIIK